MPGKKRSDLQQVLMYPKHLVYPNGESDGVEIQLEMIRAKKYCDMDMSEACPYNITVNVPLIRTVMKKKTSLETAPDPEMNERIQQQEKEEQNKENSPPLKQPTKTFPSTTCTPDCSTNFNSDLHVEIVTKLSYSEADSSLFQGQKDDKVRSNLMKSTKVMCLPDESFSVYEEPSSQEITRPSSSKDVIKTPPTITLPEPSFLLTEASCVYDPTSTPTASRVGLHLPVDITAVDPLEYNEPHPPHQSKQIKAPPTHTTIHPPITSDWKLCHNLETIQEESRSTYTTSSSDSSNCNSKLSNSSKYSSNTSSQLNEETELHELQELGIMNFKHHVDPFTTETIEFMLQSLPISNTPIYRSSTSCLRMTKGHTLTISDVSYTIVDKLKGGFASVYIVASADGSKKALKVQNPPFLWEVAITEELHKRLQANDLLYYSMCFMNINSVNTFTNASVIVYDYYPCGTLLDLTSTFRTSMKKIPENMLLYYTLELVNIVDVLHNCGIIHADIKPDNIMLRDLSLCNNFNSIKGRGLCLVDFGRAVDVRVFPCGTQFIGTCNTDSFQCIQMLNNEPWIWQISSHDNIFEHVECEPPPPCRHFGWQVYMADLHGIAGTVYVLLHLDYMEVTKNFTSGICRPSKAPHRWYDKNLWNGFFQLLLNWSGEDRPDLLDMSKPLVNKLSTVAKSAMTSISLFWMQYQFKK